MRAIYNENAAYPAQWLRNLIAAGHIADGVVDERSIADLRPADVAGPGQRHFFAGIGVWSHALRLAGWPDDRPVWTGSCPCQPFSAAGKGLGVADERHLWPEWFRLIRECRPSIILGEQVASPAGLGWLDAVSSDLEGAGYAVGAFDLCAASVGAPHIRQRLFFVAISDVQQSNLHAKERQQGRGVLDLGRSGAALCDCGHGSGDHDFGDGDCNECSCTYFAPAGVLADLRGARLEVIGEQQARRELEAAERSCAAGQLADVSQVGRRQRDEIGPRSGDRAVAAGERDRPTDDGKAHRVGNPDGIKRRAERIRQQQRSGDSGEAGRLADPDKPDTNDRRESRSGRLVQPTQDAPAGFWSDVEWIPCRDGKARPVKPGIQPLAHGAPARMGRDGAIDRPSRTGMLRSYGNAIVPQVAAEVIRALMKVLDAAEQ